MKKILGIIIVSIFLSSNALALTNDQKEIYEGCVEDATHLEQSRAKQYCKCITIMITDKYSIDEILRISQSSTEEYLEKFGFAVNYCNVNANAPTPKSDFLELSCIASDNTMTTAVIIDTENNKAMVQGNFAKLKVTSDKYSMKYDMGGIAVNFIINRNSGLFNEVWTTSSGSQFFDGKCSVSKQKF